MTDDAYRIQCSECGWDVLVEHGALMESVPPKKSAKARRAGHISGAGCDSTAVTIEKHHD